MTADLTLAEVKADHDEQTETWTQIEGLFEDLDAPPVFRGGASEYLLQLTAVPFRDNTDTVWTFWALAPRDKRWQSWAVDVARDRDSAWLDRVEHVWLIRAGVVRQALVDVHAASILQSRPYPPRVAPSPEGQQP